MLPHTRIASWLTRREWYCAPAAAPSTRFLPRALAACAIPGLVVTLALLMQSAGVTFPVLGRGWAHLDDRRWPVELAPRLASLQQASPRPKLFNALDYGGFVAFYAPGLPTFIDDRCELFGTRFLTDYAALERQPEAAFNGWANAYQFDVALVRGGSPLDAFLAGSAAWQLEERATCAALYRRCEPTASYKAPAMAPPAIYTPVRAKPQ